MLVVQKFFPNHINLFLHLYIQNINFYFPCIGLLMLDLFIEYSKSSTIPYEENVLGHESNKIICIFEGNIQHFTYYK